MTLGQHHCTSPELQPSRISCGVPRCRHCSPRGRNGVGLETLPSQHFQQLPLPLQRLHGAATLPSGASRGPRHRRCESGQLAGRGRCLRPWAGDAACRPARPREACVASSGARELRATGPAVPWLDVAEPRCAGCGGCGGGSGCSQGSSVHHDSGSVSCPSGPTAGAVSGRSAGAEQQQSQSCCSTSVPMKPGCVLCHHTARAALVLLHSASPSCAPQNTLCAQHPQEQSHQMFPVN